ncbi:T9SS type A sorting domain-containing protein [Rufibacter sp. LB8]|uniref:T9SS type A sorting domain-containing protein n=1 Tax=Rufibacter sp. LB8 TaxID=2777781 RepID=UPI00178C61CD|nr:T9SS type A sorting domain-containing protein [Rufibacter sp. LB8]
MVSILLLPKAEVNAQVTIGSLPFTYTQNFNSLPTSTSPSTTWQNNTSLPGWYAETTVNGYDLSTIKPSDGTNPTNGVTSFGVGTETNRSFGAVMTSGSDVYWGIKVKNNTNEPIRHLLLNYTVKQWNNSQGNASSTMLVSYKVGAATLTETGYISLDSMNATSPFVKNKDVLDGNLPANLTIKKQFPIRGILLQPGQEIFIRWTNQFAAKNKRDDLAIDDVQLQAVKDLVFYSKPTGSLDNVGTWSSKADLTGFSPSSLAGENQQFQLTQARLQATSLTSNLSLPASAKLVLTGKAVFNIPAAFTFRGTVDVLDSATLYINNKELPTLGQVAPGSTVVYGAMDVQDIATVTYGNLQIEGWQVKTLKSKTVVTGHLKIKGGGKLALGDFDLHMKDHRKFSEHDAQSYIQTQGKGRVRVELKAGESAKIPVGNSQYTPISLKLTSGVTDTFGVRAINSLYTGYLNDEPQGVLIDTKAVNKTWFIDEKEKGGSNMEITLYWQASDTLRGFKEDNIYLAHYENGTWDRLPAGRATLANGQYSMTRTGITSFSPFAMLAPDGPGAVPLPVSLLYLKAKRANGQVQVEWATASEDNNAFFQLEQSLDGYLFRPVGDQVEGAGNSQVTRVYQHKISGHPGQTIYLRLRQTDFDGTTTVSKAIAVAPGATHPTASLALYPNPTSGSFSLRGTYLQEGTAHLTVFHSSGKQVMTQQVQVQAGQSEEVTLQRQPAGVYFVQVRYADQQTMLRVVKQ